MMSSDDDDMEPRLRIVEEYYFVGDDDSLVSFDVLPFQFNAAEEVPSFKTDVYLRGFSDGGLQKVYKQAVAWKLSLNGETPEITVLSTEGTWIGLLKPRSSYKETARSVLVTVEMLHFVRRNPTVPDEEMWDHLHRVFGNYDVRPSVDDFRNHVRLIKLFVERDQVIAKSQTLKLFLSENTVEKIDRVSQNNENIDKVAKNTAEKLHMVGSKREEVVEDDSNHESCSEDNEMDEEEEEEDLFDSVCAICDNGGDLLCCEGSCMRSFHAKTGDGEDSYCATLGYTKYELEAMKHFLCKNCEYKQHQCFVCGELEPSDGPNAKVFLCNNATCGHFYHPKCVAQKLFPNNRNDAMQLEESIAAGLSFTCPVHWCFKCKGLEDRTQEPEQFAVCRRCPRSYHRKCLPREISFEDIDEAGIITRAWELSKRILIYCLDHDMDLDIGTPSRDHLKFPRIAKSLHSVKKKVKELAQKKRQTFDDSYFDEPVQKSSRSVVTKSMKSSFEQPVKKKAKYLKNMLCPEESPLQCHAVANNSKQQDQELATSSLPATGKIPQSSFPVADSETEKRVIALVEKELSSITMGDISQRCAIPSTYASSVRQLDKIVTQGKLERSVQAVQAALQMLEKGGTIDDAKAVCEPEVLRQIIRWNNKLRVYLAPFIHGTRYTSFGRHFTKKEKLMKIVDKLHWYVQPGDTIVDFSCGLNEFSEFMKEKLENVGKRCDFRNFDIIQPKNSFCFEKRDWMTVRPKELPHGSKLIIGLNPPFGMKATLANKFINKALSFKPKLIILIVPKETERLDQKRQPYDLIWEDTGSLSGRSFYLPGSLDVTDKQMEQWNVSPPPLYLWSRPDWTQKHRKIAEDHGHAASKIVSHFKQMNLRLDDIHRQNHGKAPYEQNDRYGVEQDNFMGESSNFVVGKAERRNSLPPEKLVEVAYEELKAASGRGGTIQADLSGIPFEERAAHSKFVVDHYSDKKEKIEVSNGSRWRGESEITNAATKADSDMSISPSDSRNLQYKSRSDSPHTTCECPSERVACLYSITDAPENIPFEDYIRNVTEYGVAYVEKHLPYPTTNVDAGLRMRRPDLDKLTGDYVGGPNSNVYTEASIGANGSFYSSRNVQKNHTVESTVPAIWNAVTSRIVDDARMYGRIRDDNDQTATGATDIDAQIRMYGGGQTGDGLILDDHAQTATGAADIHAQIRMYGGHTGDRHPRATMNPPADDIREQIRMYGRQSIQASGSSGHQSARTSPYGILSPGLTRRSMMDRYPPCLHETNYTTGPYNAPDNRRDMAPDPRGFGSRQHYPYPHPGSFGGRPG